MVIGDLHCDLPYKMLKSGKTLDNTDCDWSVLNIDEKVNFIQDFAVCVEDDKSLNSFSGALKVIDNFKYHLNKAGHHIALNSFKDNKLNAIISIEGASVLEGELSNVERFCNAGVRLMTLTWNYENELGYGAVTGVDKGLKPFGKEVVKELCRLKMAIDVSHLNEAGFYDVLENSTLPIVASHSNSKALCDNERNISNSQFDLIVKTEGLVGINAYPYFLNNTDKASVCDIIRHIEYFLSRDGENTVCLGSDLDGTDVLPEDFRNNSCYGRIIDELRKLNYSEEIIAKVTYKNITDYFNKYIFEFF